MMKGVSGPDLVVMGSGSIVSQLAQEGLVDEYQIVVHPIILGQGRTMFEGLKQKQSLKLAGERTFGNGNAFLSYEARA